MSDNTEATAELIARAARASERCASERCAQRVKAAEAEVKRITQMALGSIYAEWERRVEATIKHERDVCTDVIATIRRSATQRVEAAEARVRELEDTTISTKCLKDVVNDTIERCAQLVSGRVLAEHYREWPKVSDGNRSDDSEIVKHCDKLASVIRALRHIGRDKMFTDAMIDAAAESLAVVWFERQSQMCTIGLPIEIRRQIKQITKDMFIVAEKWKDVQVRDKPFLSIEDEK